MQVICDNINKFHKFEYLVVTGRNLLQGEQECEGLEFDSRLRHT